MKYCILLKKIILRNMYKPFEYDMTFKQRELFPEEEEILAMNKSFSLYISLPTYISWSGIDQDMMLLLRAPSKRFLQ